MLLLLFLFHFTPTSAQVPIFLYNFCKNSTEKSLTASYKSNVNKFLLWINSDSATGKEFNNNKIGSNNNTSDDVYGNYDCRADVTGSFCQFCINTAVKEIAQRCPNSDTAVIFYDVCIIRYSNKNFFGNVSTTPSWNVTGSKKIKDSTELTKVEDYIGTLIRKVTVETNQSWAASEFNSNETGKRYGFLQCARELDKEGCRQCLEAVLDLVPKCCGTKVAWEVVVPSCGIKFDDQKFFQLNEQSGSSSLKPNQGNINIIKV